MAKMSPNDGAQRRVLSELLETAQGLNQSGLLSKKDLCLISHLCSTPPQYPPGRVMEIRVEHARMSQSVFAAVLNVSVSTVQKWESESAHKHPTGAAAKLLQLIETKGIEALLAVA
ncbi:helix-turn-helix domain-containing protein [Duganella fentianensis]|uniref:helix-turn-helix domain-containing protein n=1 Tax=Duganella fentianensis TaxID=2692177 RepID=UPI0032B20A43